MAILTTSGRSALATAVKNSTLYLAWGSGEPSWDADTPREQRTATELTHEIGRRKITLAEFCTPDEGGNIIMLGARFSPSSEPTPNLHVRTEFDFNDGLGETIRELGVFISTEIQAGLPLGQTYFKPTEITNGGTLLALDYITAIQRGVGARIAFDFVITF
ncbi:hypothetical protein [Dichelobacter nodosus]|uniref:hypothetical protein n=1 Tax=Dichelobacter nodosus TaxID=870 RepID=UPI000680F646|nr:hypothetical protein [Dichelobacter nodosus]KNZ39957.1 hypothetical protein AKG33_01010 [Dichelobacter nodosus]